VTFTLLPLRGRPGLRRPPAAAAVPTPSGLPCGAREAGLHRVTRIRSLRSLRSDRHGESEVEPCKMLLHAGRLRCAPRRPTGARRRARTGLGPGGQWAGRVEAGAVEALPAHDGSARQGKAAAGDFGGGEKRRARGLRARASCTLQRLTHRDCLSAVNAVNEASFAMQPPGPSIAAQSMRSIDRPRMSPPPLSPAAPAPH